MIRAANTVGGDLAKRLRGDRAGALGVVETQLGDNTAGSVGASEPQWLCDEGDGPCGAAW